MRKLKSALVCGGASLALAATQASATQSSSGFTIKAQPASTVSLTLAQYSDRPMLFGLDLVKGLNAPGAAEAKSIHLALDRITASPALRAADDVKGEFDISGTTSATYLLTEERDDHAASAMSDQPPASAAASRAAAPETPPAPSGGAEASVAQTTMDQGIVVTGTRLKSGFNAPTPVTVVGVEQIQQRAPANFADVMNAQPAFNIAQTDTSRNNSGFPNSAQNLLDLRGLGPTRTLVLINGHRAVGTNWQGTVDTNIVPVGLVDHVDVVTGGASAAYGSDAVAGVVNIVLRDKLQGITGSAQSGLTETGGGRQYTLNLAGGTGFANGRGHVMGGIDYNTSNTINDIYGRAFGARELTQIQPTAAQRAASGLPQNVITTGVEPGTSAPGGLLYQNTVGGKAYTFDAQGNPVLFNQGTLANGQYETGSTSNYGYNVSNVAPLRIPTSRVDAYGRASFDFNDAVSGYVEGNYSHNTSGPFKTQDVILGNGASFAPLTISVNNPFVTPAIQALLNPGATTFSLGRINTEYGGQTTSQTVDTHRIVVGLKGSFLTNWSWDAYAQSGRTHLDLHRDDLNRSAFQKAVNGCSDTTTGLSDLQRAQLTQYEQISGLTCMPYNPFGVGRTSNAATDYFNWHTRQTEDIAQDVVSGSISGSPFSLPAGKVQLAFGGEYRRESIKAVSDPVSAVGTLLSSNLVQFSGQYTVKEGFAELGVPIFKDQAFAKSLDINGAIRVTNYSISGTVTTWKSGMSWEPTSGLRFRGTVSRDIRAPNLFEIFLVGGPGPFTVANHIPAGVVGAKGTVNTFAGSSGASLLPTYVVGSGGGADGSLKPEVAKTVTAGVVYQSGGFHASVDYYRIILEGLIARPSQQQVVDLCRDGVVAQCKNITFDSTVAGGISNIVAHSMNLNTTTNAGLDFEIAYRARTPLGLPGDINLHALLNYGLVNKTYTPLNGLTENDLNSLSTSANVLAPPKVAYNIDLGYKTDRLDFNINARGFLSRRGNPLIYNPNGSLSSNTVLGPEDAGYVASNNNTVNVNRFPGQLLINPGIAYKVTKNLTVFANIDNLFNSGPPAYSNAYVYDLLGRRYRFGVRFSGF